MRRFCVGRRDQGYPVVLVLLGGTTKGLTGPLWKPSGGGDGFMEAYGAGIERGIVVKAAEDGYKVKSLSRYGIITPALPLMYSGTLAVDDKVYFFLFDDGHGAILGKLE